MKLVSANRMVLLGQKKKIKLAEKGHKLLKEKQDVLIKSFFELVEQLKKTRKELEEDLAAGFKALTLAQAEAGTEAVARAAQAMSAAGKLDSSQKTIMGVKVPELAYAEEDSKPGYSYGEMPLTIDKAAEEFKKALATLIKVAEIETTVRKLGEEIKKTKRKVNALEQIVIPSIESLIRYITMRLEEMERENFSRLKVIKNRMD